MAKRKRLTPPIARADETGAPEVKSAFPRYPLGVAPRVRAPIAQVAGDAAAQSALKDLAQELHSARAEGLLVQALPLEVITADHLVRDRMGLNASEMDSLKASIRARGQQTPIEVVDRGDGSFGLISGWRRLQAVKALHAETREVQFETIKALIKPIDTVSDSYVAMVEENEIRASLSFYERAHLACEAARLGVYRDPAQAVAALFANATPARRSKIASFVKLYGALGTALRFPEAIPEKLGLALVAACEGDSGFAGRLRDVLRKTPPSTAQDERAALERALRRCDGPPASRVGQGAHKVAHGITLEARAGRVVLKGEGVTPALSEELAKWLAAR